MKTLLTLFTASLLTVTGFAQYGQRQDQRQFGYGQTISINFNGNGSGSGYQVILDGTTYTDRNDDRGNNNGNWNRNASNRYQDEDITINNVRAGQHTIQVYRTRNNRNRNSGNTSPVYSSTFTMRQGYDMRIDIRSNGQVQFSEKRDKQKDRYDRNDDRRNGGYNNGGYNNGGYNNGRYRTPMADYQFSQIYQDVKGKWFQNNKVAAVRDAFNTSNSYFSTTQIMQLLQLISAENNRLGLAKESYRVVADPANFTQVYSLFSQSARQELDNYIRNNRYN